MRSLGSEELISAETVGEYLAERGLVEPGIRVEAVELGGGVSNVVLAVRAAGHSFVVKQALPRLRVADEWLARRERAITEGEAIALGGRLTPGAVPELLDLDREACALVIAHAPGGWRSWKELLLEGEADAATAARVGEVLATWHHGTCDDADVERAFGDPAAFDELRVDPYYRTLMRRRPPLADAIARYVDRMLSTRRCLVHGDYSPKNVLVGDGGLWIVDFEVAHFGDPAFDVAFMLNHLFLKAIHRPSRHEGYARCARAFWTAYRERTPDALAPDLAYVLGQVGCLMLARVDGKSPAEYLTEEERHVARRLGEVLLLDPPNSLRDAAAAVWRR